MIHNEKAGKNSKINIFENAWFSRTWSQILIKGEVSSPLHLCSKHYIMPLTNTANVSVSVHCEVVHVKVNTVLVMTSGRL